MRNKRIGSKASLGCVIVFALPFAGVGVWMLWSLARTYGEYLAMQRWEEVPAKIVRAELKEHDGEDGTTYECVAEYTYEYAGRLHTGARVSVHGGSDNVGSFHQRAYGEIRQYREQGKPFRCYVNPGDPSQAVLYRELRPEMAAFDSIFALMFGGVGFGMLAGGVLTARKGRARTALAAAHPDEPWLWRQDWAQGEVRSSGKGLLVGFWIFTVYWNVLSLPVAILLFGPVLAGDRLALLGLLLPAIGIMLLAVALYLLLRRLKYGESVLQMADVPGVVGGSLAGVIRTSSRIRPEDAYHLTLTCVRREAVDTGDGRSTRETVLWQEERVIVRGLADNDPSQTAIPVLFAIPYDAQPTDQSNPDNQVIWRLAATASMPGIDYRATFEVPVFQTAESRPDFQLDESVLAPYSAPPDPDRQLAAAGVVVTPGPGGGTRYVLPMARHRGVGLGLVLFTAIWTGAIFAMLHFGAPVVFPIAFGLFDLLFGFALVDTWFHRSTVDVTPGRLEVTAGWFGLGRTRQIESAEIAAIEAVRGMEVGSSVYYNLVLRLQNKRKIVAGKHVFGQHQAETLARRWLAELRPEAVQT